MTVLKTVLTALVISTAIFACKKDSSSPKSANAAVEGKYVGAYGFGSEDPDIFFSLNIKPGGVIEELNSSGFAKGRGTWQLNGNTLTGNYKMLFEPYNEYSVVGTFDAASQSLNGTWGYDGNGSDGGKMEMDKN